MARHYLTTLFLESRFGGVGVGNVVIFRAHPPIGATFGFHARAGIDGGLDEVGDEGRLAPFAQALHDGGGELVAVVVVTGFVGFLAPCGLVAHFAQ